MPPVSDRNEGGHRGPLSRTWPQIFKKRRRYSPVRESAQQHHHQNVQPVQPPPPPPQQIQPVQIPIHDVPPVRTPSTTTPSIASPAASSIRSSSITAGSASTMLLISHASSAPPNKVAIARRSSSIAPADRNGTQKSRDHVNPTTFLTRHRSRRRNHPASRPARLQIKLRTDFLGPAPRNGLAL